MIGALLCRCSGRQSAESWRLGGAFSCTGDACVIGTNTAFGNQEADVRISQLTEQRIGARWASISADIPGSTSNGQVSFGADRKKSVGMGC